VFAYEDSLGPVGVAFTDRAGGVSTGSFASLNLAVRTADDPAAVGENLRRVMAGFAGDPGAPVARMRQVHGDEVAVVRAPAAELPEADALVTTVPGLTLMVLVADCVPVLLADPAAGVVAAVHAGRVGVQRGVVGAAVSRMSELGARELTAWIGPHVCGACYEVPEQMRDEVAGTVPQAYAETSWGTPAIDLGAAVAAQLKAAGARMVDASRCSLEHDDLHSYRRDGAGAGRMAGMIRIEPTRWPS
jgi:YfiH family protein